MKKTILVLITVFCLSVTVVPKPASGNPKPTQDVIIITRQPKSAFTAIVTDGKTCLKNWSFNFYHSQEDENHIFKIVIDGEKKAQGEFKGFHHTVKKIFPKGHYSKVKVYLDGKLYLWEDVQVMKKAPSQQQLEESTKPENVALSIRQWLMQQFGLIVLGCVLGLAAVVTQRWFVQRKKESEVLEGL